MNPNLARLQAYPFERLRALLADAVAPAGLSSISLSIGEPRHEPPAFVLAALARHLHQLDSYPATRGRHAARSGLHGVACERHSRGAVRPDPGGRR
jgi:N-succinyldiaminopimelate aminotransferase